MASYNDDDDDDDNMMIKFEQTENHVIGQMFAWSTTDNEPHYTRLH